MSATKGMQTLTRTKAGGLQRRTQDAGRNQPQEKARGRERKLTVARHLDEDASGAALA